MVKGTKRASPGAEDEKDPVQSAELGEEDAKKLQVIQRDIQRAELILERDAQKALKPIYERRREILKGIENFWAVALLNHSLINFHVQHNADKTALAYLEDVWVEKDPVEHRCFTIEFHFKENKFFEDKVLKKEYKYITPPASDKDQPDAEGLTETMLEFSWERDVEIKATKIHWKSPENALTTVYPRMMDEDDDEGMPADPGSFFNFFEYPNDPSDMGLTIANEVFPEAIEYFLGTAGGEEVDSDDEEDSDDSDGAEEIDLEKPRSKKQKV